MLAGLERPAESRAHVVALGDDEVVALRPFGLRREVGRSRDCEVVLGVSAPQLAVLAGGSESLRGELADRLQHPVARLAVLLATSNQALVQQGLQPVRVGIAHALRGLVVAASCEDRERTKEPLLLWLQQVVRPLDRRPQRLLPRIGVPARLQQVEALRQPLDELLRREDDGSGSGELERERQVVEPPAELGDGLRLLRRRVERPCAGEEQLDSVLRLEARHRIHVLALELEPLAARDDNRRPGDVPQLGNLRRDLGHEVLGVVQHQERLLPGELSCDALGKLAARLLFDPERLCNGRDEKIRIP